LVKSSAEHYGPKICQNEGYLLKRESNDKEDGQATKSVIPAKSWRERAREKREN